jgi:hypothetical protein
VAAGGAELRLGEAGRLLHQAVVLLGEVRRFDAGPVTPASSETILLAVLIAEAEGEVTELVREDDAGRARQELRDVRPGGGERAPAALERRARASRLREHPHVGLVLVDRAAGERHLAESQLPLGCVPQDLARGDHLILDVRQIRRGRREPQVHGDVDRARVVHDAATGDGGRERKNAPGGRDQQGTEDFRSCRRHNVICHGSHPSSSGCGYRKSPDGMSSSNRHAGATT